MKLSPFESSLRKNATAFLIPLVIDNFFSKLPPFDKCLYGVHDHHDCDLNPHILLPLAIPILSVNMAICIRLYASNRWKETPVTFISPATWAGRSELYVKRKKVGSLGMGILREPAFT